VQQIQDDDAGYLDWLETNPHAYVLNAERSPNKGYLIPHSAPGDMQAHLTGSGASRQVDDWRLPQGLRNLDQRDRTLVP